MNIKPILVLIVLAAILSVSIVAAYENVEHNSNGNDGVGVPSHHDIHHRLHNAYTPHNSDSKENDLNKTSSAGSPDDLIAQGYLYDVKVNLI